MSGYGGGGGGGGGGEIERNQSPTVTTTATTSNLAFRADGSVYKPIMPPTDDGNPFHHVPLHYNHHQDMMVGGGGGGGIGIGLDALNMNNNHSEPIKRKRGRPRKYSPPPHGNIDLTSPPQHQLYQCGFQSPTPSSTAPKKARGRPPGSARKNHLPNLGSGGTGFTPHVIFVKAGEDVLLKIMSFSQNGPRGVCILSAYGTISNVTLRQATTIGGTVTYEGRFEILSLSGSFLLSENSGQRSRTGGLSVLLSGPDGRVLGGGVAGLLTAASSVQVIVGSFISEDSKGSKLWINQHETMSAPGASVAGSPPSRGTFSESSGGPGSPPNQSTGACNNSNTQGMPNVAWK
ncbi:AT-hook motif nuclear-localized protein 10 [Ricinus communis]|uniref:AT-hook motif nuclear-localized protein n=1 Tax=Ricinus communis TaxID=3988 RepID=B9T2L2_RICCO|nr:AT-hook motif nuclear-localized protein 10 [Ricinus communis]EEF29905.1 DNA binding protein, putative [Ricinus communis]|eukprot:XP_002532481.1 AT-hook motif nuclear-localized protein 10 [Ricinus communis]